MTEPRPANARLVRQGGLMRCCTATIAETEDSTEVGDMLDCKYEPVGNKNLIVADDGVWEWNRPGASTGFRRPT